MNIEIMGLRVSYTAAVAWIRRNKFHRYMAPRAACPSDSRLFRTTHVSGGHEAEGYIAKEFIPSPPAGAIFDSTDHKLACDIPESTDNTPACPISEPTAHTSTLLANNILCLLVLLLVFSFAATHCAGARAESATKLIKLANGVRLVYRHETEDDTLAITLLVREETTASPTEEAVRRMVNASLFYGSVHLSYDAAGAIAGKIGSISTRQTPDCVAITCVTTPARYRDAIYLLCEVIKNAEFSSEALERARTTVLRLREERGSDPFLAAYDVVTRSLTTRYEPDGVQLRHVKQDQAVAYFNAHFVPARTVFSAVGNIDAAVFQRSLDNNLFGYERPGAPIPVGASTTRHKIEIHDTVNIDTPGGVSYALVAVDTPFIADPDYPAFCVVSTLLGGGNASRMFREIRDAAGIGYSVGTALRPEDGDPMVAYVEWDESAATSGKATSAQSVMKRIQDQLDSLISITPIVTDAEIERAKNFASGQYILRHERIQERCFLPGWYEMMGAGSTLDDDLPVRLSSVTKDDLLRVARKYLAVRAAALGIGSK